MTLPNGPRRRALGVGTLAVSAVVGLAAACASPGVPPGGPEDRRKPALVSTSPDTNALNARPRAVVFTFDEVISETPRGGGGGGGGAGGNAGAGSPLEPLVLLSPRAGSLEVSWQRERIVVRPRRGFKPNTTYTVTLLPGIADLRDNVRDSASVLVFSTGPRLERGTVGGVIFDWAKGTPAARAVVEAIADDSTTYWTLADSVGRFLIPNVPPGPYVVRGTLDDNTNRTADPREAFDTVRVNSGQVARSDSNAAELYAFRRDTLPARVQQVEIRDSVTLRVTFDRPLLPGQPVTADQFRLVARDSSVVPITAAYEAAQFDSLLARQQRASADSALRARGDSAVQRARRDSLARDSVARRDSIARAQRAAVRPDTAGPRRPVVPPPVLRRPVPGTAIVLRLGEPLRPQTAYRLSARDVRSLNGVTGRSERGFNTPRAAPPPPARPASPAPGAPAAPGRPPADTTRRPPASAAPADTTRRPPPAVPPRPPAGAPDA